MALNSWAQAILPLPPTVCATGPSFSSSSSFLRQAPAKSPLAGLDFYVNQAGLETCSIPMAPAQALGLQTCTTLPILPHPQVLFPTQAPMIYVL